MFQRKLRNVSERREDQRVQSVSVEPKLMIYQQIGLHFIGSTGTDHNGHCVFLQNVMGKFSNKCLGIFCVCNMYYAPWEFCSCKALLKIWTL